MSAGAAVPTVPVIDLQKLKSGDSMDSELQKLHSACQQWGSSRWYSHKACREIMEAYGKEIKNVAMIILCQLAKALRMDEKEMREPFSDGVQSIRMNYYPPCPEPHKTIGFSPHSDADALTILFQLNETEGLQVRKDDIWVPIKLLPNALIVNIGDIMEVNKNILVG
ncbi:hypothetical protein RND71_033644 [Anisodus tanguticus]|uniref:Fe2OG dioxygenase domain-containing protein n=1 Tax=Anisodus tanguticus TaxID=243964 RepID=A0AAE1V456_9SOLA|nr:hypothetical protein RND71_033644 [Anisodus tanguticus]